ncbi:TonB-dependent receptor [Bradyrhizobium sp. G127]|jgi:iron complex outermembrane receptor protein|uniref:TonB-dependent receptor n=1 Tax=Bradyrhizobium sp. G127 TaxID=2904800 RepID=UPI001F464708|nr:TonB-dependent receptor [Bradyrhizobium sp. G127]MCF2525093.1 TonB-dependent receptor [Bradyrhizobium sp. G127]
MTAGLAGTTGIKAQEVLPEIAVSAPADAPSASGDGLQRGPVNATDTTFQSTTTVTGREIGRSSAASLADVLSTLPGVSSSTFAPGASRPNIRGLDDYRVRVQENGIGSQDASDFSQDHQVPIDPLSADKIEVIRGPATLRYGSQAIGGVVSATNNRIPEALTPGGFSARFKGGASSVDNGLDGAVSLDASGSNVAFHADAYGRRAGDYRIPGGVQTNTRLQSEGQSVGGSYIFDGGYIGTAIQHITSLYHIPGVIDTRENTRIDLEQTKWTSKGEWRAPTDGIDAVRFTFGASDYRHNELGIGSNGIDGVQNVIKNRELEGRFELDHAAVATALGALTGTWGAQVGHRELGTAGSLGGLLAPTKTDTAAIFGFEQIKFTDTLKLQVAGRIEHHLVKGLAPSFPADFLPPPNTFTEEAGRRSFAPKSVSVGVLKDLPWDMVATLTAQRVQRAPAAPELYSRGSDDASGTFVIGNPNLKIETAQTAEIGLKRANGQLRFETSLYYTYYQDFIFKQVTGNFCTDAFITCGATGPLIQVAYGQRDAIFRGAELAAQLDVTPLGDGMFGVDGQYDIVRATFTDGTNVPRIAPMRLGGGVWWRNAEWYARVGVLHAFTQNEVSLNETPTDGYNLLRAELSYTHAFSRSDTGPREITVGLAGDNLLNEAIRNHISFKKAEVLQPGLGVRLFTNVRF